MRKIRPEMVSILLKSTLLGSRGWNVSPGKLASESKLLIKTAKLVQGLKTMKHNKKFMLMKSKAQSTSLE